MNQDEQSLIKAFQSTLSNHIFNDAESFSEDFAIARFKKKYQVPNVEQQDALKADCWETWISFDQQLPKGKGYFLEIFQKNPTFWFNVRERIRKNLKPFHYSDEVDFSSGSTFGSTRNGSNSVEAKLASLDWYCTRDNFDGFARVAYANNALKKALRRHWIYFNKSKGFSIKEAERVLYRHATSQASHRESLGFQIFKLKLRFLLPETWGSQFVSIPKNNENRRPINIEPFCNVIVQKQIGSHLRKLLKSGFHVDLDTLAMKHYSRISDSDIATIDLKNASDAFSISLCEFLLPKWFFKTLMSARSPFILGPDDDFHLVNKISAMGNGFTFELMTFILTSVCRELDPAATVFGDDIIIVKDKALELMSFLKDMGLVVNTSKSFVSGPFRESCGGNFHDEEGYIESFDFYYPESINDCVVTYNKVAKLSRSYRSFALLERKLYRHIPQALRGGALGELDKQVFKFSKKATSLSDMVNSTEDLSNFFCCDRRARLHIEPKLHKKIKRKLKQLCILDDFIIVTGFTAVTKKRTSMIDNLCAYHEPKYLMYLYAGRKCEDEISHTTTWEQKTFVTVGERTFSLSSLLNPNG